jgi:hypothetical protein
MLSAALVCAVAPAVQAEQRVSSSTLQAMGLSGLVVMTDSDAMSIRGKGFSSGGYQSKKDKHSKKKDSKPWASASGNSWAEVELDGHKAEAEAGTRNKYAAEGKYEASGDNNSEAELEKTYTKRVDYSDGTYSIETKTYKIEVEAGGWSSSKAF